MSEAKTISTVAGSAALRRSDRRTLAISVLPNGSIELVAPRVASEEDIAAKVRKKLRWISRQRAVFLAMNGDRKAVRYESGATHRYLGSQYRLKVRIGKATSVRLAGRYIHIQTRNGTLAEVRDALDEWLKERARAQFSTRLAKWSEWCAARQLPLPKLQLRRMPKRWGSAHRDGRIFLNPDLIKAPSICVDYVIAHEICHLKYPRHSRAFFSLLDHLVPNWPSVKSRLEHQE